MEYRIASGSGEMDLAAEVAELASRGFIPQGGVAVMLSEWENERKGYTEYETTFYQAMIRVEAAA